MNAIMRTARGLAVLVVGLSLALAATAADWPVWRGPQRDSTIDETIDVKKLTGKPEIAWEKNLGVGYANVTVVDGRLYTMGNDGKQDTVWCLDADTGEKLWAFSYRCGRGGGYAGPKATPVVVDGRVFTLSQDGQAYALDAVKGTEIWKRNLVKEFGAKPPKWRFAGSACPVGPVLLYNANQYGIALYQKTGKKLWASPAGRGSYAVPVLTRHQGQTLAMIFSSKALNCVEAKTGRKLWDYTWHTAHDVNAADPLVNGSQVMITSGYGKGCAMIDFSSGKPVKKWQNKSLASHFSSSVLLDGHVYGIHGNAGRGTLKCLRFADGKEQWGQKTGFGSLVLAGDKLIVLTERGRVVVVEPSTDGYKELASCRIMKPRGRCWTMPVVVGGKLYCRSSSGQLVAADVGK